jgi:hypothetical protein
MNDARFVYDDDCGFCTWCADLFDRRTDIGIVGFTELTDAERARLPDDYEDCAHLLTDGAVYSCGAAIEQGLALASGVPGSRELFDFLGQFEDYEQFREKAYREFADRRDLWGKLLRKEPPARED